MKNLDLLLNIYNIHNDFKYYFNKFKNNLIDIENDIIIFISTTKINDQLVHDNHYYSCIISMYYDFQKKDHKLLKKYYLISTNNGNMYSAGLLGQYYHYVKRKYDLMKKYYLIAINKGNDEAMYDLGYYYSTIEKKYDLMKKYYLMGIEKKIFGLFLIYVIFIWKKDLVLV